MSRRTRAEIRQLESQIIEVLKEDNPQSVRHVFYRMTDPRLPEPVEKTEAGYKQIQARLAIMRRNGTVPFRWITDATRRGFHVSTYETGGEFVASMARHYRSEIWANTGIYVEVWCESRSIAGVIQADCEELAVSLYPAGGFSSLTLIYEAARHIKYYADSKIYIIYVGDYDPAGVLIDQAIEKGMREHGVSPNFKRIAINPDQIEKLDLPTKPRKEGDKRRPDVKYTVEAEAMPAKILRALLSENVEGLLPEGALEVAKIAEESEREGLEKLGMFAENSGLESVLQTLEIYGD